MADEPKQPNVFQKVSGWAEQVVQWVEATFSDPALSEQITADLGLDSTAHATPAGVKPADKAKIDEFVKKQDVDKESLAAVVSQVKSLVETGLVFADAVKADDLDGMDVLWLLFKVWVADSLRARNPAAYGLVNLAGLITQDEEAIGALDLAPIGRLFKGEVKADAAEVVDRLSLLVGTTVILIDALVHAADDPAGAGPGYIDAVYGWDPDPDDDPTAAGVASRALTVAFNLPGSPVTPMLTLIGVPAEHGGPGIVLSLGAKLEFSGVIGSTKFTVLAGADGAFAVYLGAGSPRVLGDGVRPSLAIRTEPAGAVPGRPALVLGTSTASRLEIGSLATGIEVGADFAALRFAARNGKLVISLSEGDGFLRSLPGGSIEAPFDLGLVIDTKGGVRFEGGTGLKVNLPIAASLFGVFTVQYIELELVLSQRVKLELRGGFSVKLGPFSASVDKLGIGADLTALTEGADFGSVMSFLPPKGIGLRLDAGVVKGGGYLFIDAERGEYAGALELTFVGVFSVKAICLITTKRPDGSEGWSLLLLIFGQFSIHIAFGIFLTGIGGLIGLHHRIDTQALTDGMKTGALDDILFPENPVADAPRIINRYRQLFPIEPDSLVLGPMLELSFSEPPIVYVRLGLLFEVRNALGGGPMALTKVVLIGQLLAQLPPKATGVPAILKLLIDVVGYYDAQEKFLMIRARLRDSFVGIEGFATLNLSGELMLAMGFGDDPSFILSAGGFHPSFHDFPKGVPDKLERMAVSFSIGGVVNFRTETYFAITSNSVQAGFRVSIAADFGVASIEGWLGFDAMIILKPKFGFIVIVDFSVSVHAFGEKLCAVSVNMELNGPGEWRAKGKFSFSILWWDVDVPFDESWGSAPAITEQTASATQALLADLQRPERLLPEAPVGNSGLVTLATIEAGPVPFAHPLGRLTIAQKSIPFEVTIDRMGTKKLTEGAVRYAVGEVTVGGRPTTATQPVVDHFARGQYMELSEQERIGGKSFERFPCGVSVGSSAYRVDKSDIVTVAKYEEKILEPEPLISRFPWKLTMMGRAGLSDEMLGTHVAMGAAAQSVRAAAATMLAGGPGAASVLKQTPLTVVNATTLAPEVVLTGAVAGSDAVAQQTAGLGSLVMESFELVGV